jgi:hypothetical protein
VPPALATAAPSASTTTVPGTALVLCFAGAVC